MMPSIVALLSLVAISLGSFQLSIASPVPTVTKTFYIEACATRPVTRVIATPAVPTSNGTASLPPPLSNLTLAHVTLGRGKQNYTCSSNTSVPVAIGAVAILFDFTSLAFANLTKFNQVPPLAVNTPLTSFESSGESITIDGVGTFPQLGLHYFLADGTPTFNLSVTDQILYGKKVGDIKAPISGNLGPAKTGPVDWLTLGDNGKSTGLKEVYRVETAGGNPPLTCEGYGVRDVISVQYAAQYWFYGPK